MFSFVRVRLPPRSTRTEPLFPSTTLCRSAPRGDRMRVALSGLGLATTVRMVDRVHGRAADGRPSARWRRGQGRTRSEEHTSELQSLMRISYAVFCLKKKKRPTRPITHTT